MRVIGVPQTRHSLESVRQLLIDTPNGEQVPLSDVAEVVVAPTPNDLKHETLSRYIDVTANVRGRDLGSVVGDIEAQAGQRSTTRSSTTPSCSASSPSGKAPSSGYSASVSPPPSASSCCCRPLSAAGGWPRSSS